MKSKNYTSKLILSCIILGMIFPNLALAQSNPQTRPVYQESSDAMVAQQRARQHATTPQASLSTSLNQIHHFESQLSQSQKKGDKHQIGLVESALHTAEDMYMNKLSTMTGVSLADLEKMHEAGVSYGTMATDLGVKVQSGQMPGYAAMNNMQLTGNSRQNQNMPTNSGQHSLQGIDESGHNSMMDSLSGEIKGATARNTESGWSEGHGRGMQTNTGGKTEGGMIGGAGGLSNGMKSAEGGGHDAGGMGASGHEGSSSGSSSSGGMGGSSGGGGSSSGGGHGGGHGGGGGGGMM